MLLSLKHCPKIKNFSLFITTREGGESTGKYKSFNLGMHSGDDKKQVRENRKMLAQVLWKKPEDFIYLNLNHGDDILLLDKETDYQEMIRSHGYDACLTNQHNCIPLVTVADCVPIIVVDEKKGVFGAIHSGWKGSSKNIVGKTIQTMQSKYGCHADDIKIVIGPCISAENYEVDECVIRYFDSGSYTQNKTGGYHLDLRKVIELQAKNIGIQNDHIHHVNFCTFSHKDMFFSARRDGFESGRFIMGVFAL